MGMARLQTKRTAGILLLSEGRILLLLRSLDRPNGGLWDLPGGQLRHGESAADGAWREAREEVGPLPPAGMCGRIRVVRGAGAKRYDAFVVRAPRSVRTSWTPRLSREHSEARWVDLRWCMRRLDRLHPVLRRMLTDDDAFAALRRESVGKTGFRRASGRHQPVALRPAA